jgi:hypothetical protein
MGIGGVNTLGGLRCTEDAEHISIVKNVITGKILQV